MATNEPILPAEEPQIQDASKARKIMMWATIVIALIVIGIVVYIFAIRQPGIEKANNAIADADLIALTQGNDSLALQAYEQVANDYGYDAGNRAKLQSAIILYRQGEYQKALDYVSDYSASDNILGSLALGLKGDCLVNLDKNSDAIHAFDKAISKADKNPQLVPYFMGKKATVLSAEGDYKKGAEVYKEIETKYPGYAQRMGVESRRIQAEALAAAN